MKFLGFGSQDSTNAVVTLASANLGLAGVDAAFFKQVDSWLHVLLAVAQVGVGVLTMYFIWCKARKIVRGAEKKRSRKSR